MSLAVIWHYWIGVVFVISAIAVTAAVVVGYFNKVVRPKYPPRR